jgi:hypothetical protein
MIPDLETLQRMLQRLIATPMEALRELDSERAPVAGGLEALIVGDSRLSALRRLEIYAGAYFQRLLEVMREDFPATRTAVGDDRFTALVREYLAAHPPTEPSVFYAGRALPQFLAEHHGVENFAAELARLERTTIEVFHGPEAVALSAAAMGAIAPERWPTLALRTHPALKLLDCEFAVGPLLRAIWEGAPWPIPQRGPVSIVVWRQASQVYFRTLEPGEREALGAASEGASFAAICAAASEKIEGDAVAAINRMLARWLADELLAAADG